MQKPDYQERLRAVEAVALRCSGNDSLGLFGGIYLQTKWQMDSGRDALPIWHLVNHNLTLVPYRCHEKYRVGEQINDEVERIWLQYFLAVDQARDLLASSRFVNRVRGWLFRLRLQRKFWKAHTDAMRHALKRHGSEFCEKKLSRPELDFCRGWIRVVLANEKIAPPTTELIMRPFLTRTMPKISPLDEVNVDRERSRVFLKLMMLIGKRGF